MRLTNEKQGKNGRSEYENTRFLMTNAKFGEDGGVIGALGEGREKRISLICTKYGASFRYRLPCELIYKYEKDNLVGIKMTVYNDTTFFG